MARIRYLRALAHNQKGLDDETYRLHLSQAGVSSTLELTTPELFNTVEQSLKRLPDQTRPRGASI